jgi:hypothetical protein
MAPEPIKIHGLKEFSRSLRRIDSDLPKALRVANNYGADVVVQWAQPRVPHDSGAAAGSIRAKSTRTSARVAAGSAAVPYYAWLDWGGRVGVRKSVYRPFLTEGRYLYPGLEANREKIIAKLAEAYADISQQAGVQLDG